MSVAFLSPVQGNIFPTTDLGVIRLHLKTFEVRERRLQILGCSGLYRVPTVEDISSLVRIGGCWWTGFVLVDLNTKLFVGDHIGPELLWAIQGAGYEDQSQVGTKVVEVWALGEVTQVGGTDSSINLIERSRVNNKQRKRTSGYEAPVGDPTMGRR